MRIHTENEIQTLAIGLYVVWPLSISLTSSPSTLLRLTLFQHAEHTLTSGPLHWLLSLLGGLFPQTAHSLTSIKVSNATSSEAFPSHTEIAQTPVIIC